MVFVNDVYVVARKQAVVDLIALAHEAADVLTQRGTDAQEHALADALRGASAEVAVDLVPEPTSA